MMPAKEPLPKVVGMDRECGDSYSHFWRIKGVGDFESREDAELFVQAKAERDPTPLTDEVMVSLGLVVREYTAGTYDDSLIMYKRGSGGAYFVHGLARKTISTVGELRTLARLAGVELKGGE